MTVPRRLVLDTNIVLDLFVFGEATLQPLLTPLRSGALQWIATAPMRDELARVLDYPPIRARLLRSGLARQSVLDAFDQLAHRQPVAARAAFVCKDADDQCFIDLALAWQAQLLSKDRAVLSMAKRLRGLGVRVCAHWDPSAPA